MTDAGFPASVAFRVAGMTYRMGDHAARTGVVRPSIAGSRGRGAGRRYSLRDIVMLRTVRELRDAGLSLQRVRTVVKRLAAEGEDLASVRVLTDGREAWVALDREHLLAMLEEPGQVAWRSFVDVGRVAREVAAALEAEGIAA